MAVFESPFFSCYRIGLPAVELLLSQLDLRGGEPAISVELSMIMDAMRISLESDDLEDD
jgi:hypothetical protein